jgi:DNA-binding MarR family transcriptional regulator
MQTTEALRLRHAINALVRRFQLAARADFACCGMTVAQAATLRALAAEDDRRSSNLSRHLGVSPSTLTRNLDRLEERGLVERTVDPSDRRAMRISLTLAGREAAATAEATELVFIQDVLDRLSSAGVRDVVPVLEQLLAAVRGATERCCPGAFEYPPKELSNE